MEHIFQNKLYFIQNESTIKNEHYLFSAGTDITIPCQIDIMTYQVRKIKAFTSLCLFADELITNTIFLLKFRCDGCLLFLSFKTWKLGYVCLGCGGWGGKI